MTAKVRRERDVSGDARLLTSTPVRLIAMTGLTNLAFWLLWPASIVRVAASGWGPTATGLFGSVAPLTMFIALSLALRLLALFGPRHVTAVAVTLVATSSLGSAFLPIGLLEWLWTAMLGLGTGLRWIAADSWIADAVPPERSGRILSLGESVVGLGFAAGPVIASELGNHALALGLGAGVLSISGALLVARLAEPVPRHEAGARLESGASFAGIPMRATALLIASAMLGGINETGFAGIAPLLSIVGGSGQPLYAAAAVGLGSFVAQYGLGAAADRWGGCKALMACAVILSGALAAIAVAPSTLPFASFLIGASGGGLYTVAVVFGLQARRSPGSSAALIGTAAIAYSAGSMVAPAGVGLGIDMAGAAVMTGALSALAAALFGGIIVLRGWRWVDRNRAQGATCTFRVSPQASARTDST